MTQVLFLPDQRELTVDPPESLLDAALRQGIPHVHACGGKGRCSTCRVMVREGLEHCTPRSPEETLLSEKLHFKPDMRLACQTRVTGPSAIRRLVLDELDIEAVRGVEGRRELAPVGEEKRLAILFTDLRGFTTFAEALPPYDVVHVLNRHFQLMDAQIRKHGGIINNYMGDGCMALFGLSGGGSHALAAVRAGLDMMNAATAFKTYLTSIYGCALEMGIGVHVGTAIVGAVGVAEHKRITAIGDAVNFASRIESATKEAGVRFLISDETYQEVQSHIRVGKSVQVAIKGKTGMHILHEVVEETTPR